MNLLKSLALVALFALVSCSDDSPVCSCNHDDPGVSSSSIDGNSSSSVVDNPSSSSSTILQTAGLTFVSAQEIPPNYVSFSDTEWTGTVSPGGIITLRVTCANEMSELYLKINSENGYYVRQITAENIVSSEPGSYIYYFTFAFSLELNHVGEMEFSISGKAKATS